MSNVIDMWTREEPVEMGAADMERICREAWDEAVEDARQMFMLVSSYLTTLGFMDWEVLNEARLDISLPDISDSLSKISKKIVLEEN